MMMLMLRLSLAVLIPVTVFGQASPPGFIRWGGAELADRQAALTARVGSDGSARETLADYGNSTGAHRFRFIHRDSDGAPEQHAQIEDVVFIQSGEAVLQLGGDLVDPSGRNGELTGSAIVGGVTYPVQTGDLLHIPANTPHRYLVPDGGQVTYLLVRMPVLLNPVLPDDAPVLTYEPPGFAMWTASELARRKEVLSTHIREDRSSRETLADYGSPTRSHRFRHIHRDADGVPEIHDDIIDVVFITSGTGQILVGGEMLDRDGSLGSGIAGGIRQPAVAGDVLHIPAKTPHGYLVPEGGHVTYVLVRVPARVAH